MNLFNSFVLVRCLRSRLGGTSRGGGWSRVSLDWLFMLVDLVVYLLSRSECVNNIALVDRWILNFIWLIGGFWIGKVPFGLLLKELANWLICISNLNIACEWLFSVCPWFCMIAAWDFIKASMLFSNLLNFFFIGELWEEEDGAWLEKFIGWVKIIGKV